MWKRFPDFTCKSNPHEEFGVVKRDTDGKHLTSHILPPFSVSELYMAKVKGHHARVCFERLVFTVISGRRTSKGGDDCFKAFRLDLLAGPQYG
ncbi:uncharacterized [Tachysurus ichikawai]